MCQRSQEGFVPPPVLIKNLKTCFSSLLSDITQEVDGVEWKGLFQKSQDDLGLSCLSCACVRVCVCACVRLCVCVRVGGRVFVLRID